MPEYLSVICAVAAYFGVGVTVAIIHGYFTGEFDDFQGVLTFLWPFILLIAVIFIICIGPYKLMEWAAAKGKIRKNKGKECSDGVSDKSASW